MQFENNLRALINSHMTMLNQGQTVIPNPVMNVEAKAEAEDSIKTKVKSAIETAANNLDL